MTDYFDDDSDFWGSPRSEPTIQIDRVRRRTPERTRSHHVVKKDPTPTGTHRADRFTDDESSEYEAVWLEPVTGAWSRPSRRQRRRGGLGVFGGVDPRLLSVGAMAVVAVLAVPLFGALGNDGGGDTFRTVTEATSTTTTVPPAPTTTVAVVRANVTPTDDGDDAEEESTAPRSEQSSTASSGDSSSGGNTGSNSGAAAATATATADTVLAAPSVRSAAQCGNPYEVQPGDFWVKLADQVGMSLQDFVEYNEATRDTPLYPGDTICLPLGTSITTPTTAPPATEAPTTAPPATDPPSTDAPTTPPPATAAPTDPPTTPAPQTDPPVVTTDPPPATTQAPADDDDDDDDYNLPTAPVPSGGQVEAMIREIWPDDLEEQALRIAWRESNYRPDVTSGSGCCHGVFQMHEQHLSWLSSYGVTSVSQLFDARTNIEAAYALYQRSGGWGPWRLTAGP